jgi:hypothetical protein
MSITITTCLYDIRKKEGSTCQNISTLQNYLELSRHMLRVRLPMVIFTDEEEIVAHVYKTRLEYGLLDRTMIVRLPFEQTLFYQDLDMLKQRMEEFQIVNWNRDKDTPLYILLNNNKFDFLKRSMEMNFFHTEFFLWMDMGLQHCTKATEKEWLDISETWPSFIQQDREHVHQLRIHTVAKPDDMEWKDYFRMIYHHVAGGLFGGHRDRMEEYIRLFQDQWHKMLYEEKWWQLDEAVMTILTETYPEKFRFFYGDYDGMLSNFIQSKKSFGLVLQTAQRHLDARKYDLSDHVLATLDFDCLVGTEYYEKAVNMKICNDYYVRDGFLSPMLSEILSHHDIPLKVLLEQLPNIRHLSDPSLSSFFARWAFQNPQNDWAVRQWSQIPQRHTFSWQHLGPFSKTILNEKKEENISSPFECLGEDPEKLLDHFQSQFGSLPETDICSLYNLLEADDQNVFFLWSTPSFLTTQNHDIQQQQSYDRSILHVYQFLKRNFPQLNFFMICLYANRPWTLPHEQTPHGLLVFTFEMPYSFHSDEEFYRQTTSLFVRLMRFRLLLLNHKQQHCGVYQYGKRLHDILKKYKHLEYEYQEVETEWEYHYLLDNNHYDAVLYNYCPPTMPWLNEHTIRHTQQNIGVLHECERSFFDKKVMIDPVKPESHHVYTIPRPLIEDIPTPQETCDMPEFQEFVSFREGDTPVFGTFGFGFVSKGFPKIVQYVNEQYDKAIIKMVIPCAYYGGEYGTIKQICDACAEQKTKPNIFLMIFTDFVSEHDLLLFLQSNTMNIFMYDTMGGRDTSSTIDYALSVQCPLGISDSYMFRNIYTDDICLYKNPIQKCMENSVEHCKKFLSLYSHEKMRNKILHILLDP